MAQEECILSVVLAKKDDGPVAHSFPRLNAEQAYFVLNSLQKVKVPLNSATKSGRKQWNPGKKEARRSVVEGTAGRLMADVGTANEDRAAFDDEVGRLDVAEKSGGGFEHDGAGALDAGNQFAANLSAAELQRFVPAKMGFRRDNQSARGKAAFDGGGGMDLEGALDSKFTDKPASDDRVGDAGVGVEEVTFFFDDESAKSAKVFRDGVGDLVIAQVHVAAALFAHGGGSRDGNLQVGTALEATDVFLLDVRFLQLGSGRLDVVEPEVGAAFLADGRVGARGLLLFVPAFGAGDGGLLLL
jgi:hypothetical protein